MELVLQNLLIFNSIVFIIAQFLSLIHNHKTLNSFKPNHLETSYVHFHLIGWNSYENLSPSLISPGLRRILRRELQFYSSIQQCT